MSELGWLAVYSTLVLLASLIGAYLPFRKHVTHSTLQLYLSVAAGVMLGASFFHIMPEAMAHSGSLFGWWMSLGVVGLFCIERFIAPHSHEVGVSGREHQGGHDHAHHEHHHHHEQHDHHEHATPAQERRAAPAVAGWTAVLGLTMHTFMNGVGLAGAVHIGIAEGEGWLPGLALFAAIILHKPADALAISVVLSRKGVKKSTIALVQVAFGITVAVGALLFYLTAGHIAAGMENQLTGAALSISAGTFLFIALSDLLPEVQFHRHDRLLLFSALVAGVALMGAIGLLEGHDHGHSHAAGEQVEDEHDHGHDHGHKHKHDHDHDHGKEGAK
jgi:zinc and cadmium transporter